MREYSHVIWASRLPKRGTMSISVHAGSMGLRKRNCKPSRERKILTLSTKNFKKKNEENETTKKSNSGHGFENNPLTEERGGRL